MDAYQIVAEVSAAVQQAQLPVHEYIADPRRDPLQLPVFRQSMIGLLYRLQRDAHGNIPQQAFSGHCHSTNQILEVIKSIEDGFSRSLNHLADHKVLRYDIEADILVEMLRAKMTDVQIGQSFGCSARTIYRRRHDEDVRILRRARMNSTPDEVLAEVRSPISQEIFGTESDT